MVAPITLNVRHINGTTFTVEVDHEADALGVKVLIWEAQQIPVDQQRLVFGGKELADGVTLSSMGISDGAQLFLVESALDAIDQASAVVPPAFAGQEAEAGEAQQSGSFMVSMPQPDSRYELVPEEEASNERISGAVVLAKYVRVYCIFGFILCALSSFHCLFSIIPTLFFLLGWIGTRKLNRCLIAFPMIISFLIGFFGTGHLIYCGIEYGHEWLHGVWVPLYVIALLVGVFHVLIFFSISKLICRIGKLSRDEWCNARARIISRGRCC